MNAAPPPIASASGSARPAANLQPSTAPEPIREVVPGAPAVPHAMHQGLPAAPTGPGPAPSQPAAQAPQAHAPAAPVNGAHANGGHVNGGQALNAQCTAPQLRRFIKSRPYVPMHELRRRFGIDGGDDDVTPVRLEPGWVYVGLPTREGGLLGELLKAGEIGYELSLDPRTPIVIGIYPMRPIPRS